MLTGEAPEVNPQVAERLRSYGHEDFVSYVVWACERALERGLLPHTNLGVLSRRDLARLREVTASQGLMLESVSERLMETVHAGSPTKHPASSPGDDRGRRRAADPVHQRHPGRDRRDRGRTDRLARGARRGQRPPRPHPGGDPAELRPASEVLRAGGGGDRGRGFEAALGGRSRQQAAGRGRARAAARVGDGDHAGRHEAPRLRGPRADARRRHPDPAQPLGLVARPRRRGRHRPRRAVGERRPHLARAGVPEPAPGAKAPRAARPGAHRASLRLPAVPRPGVDRAGRPRRGQAQVLELHPAARLGPALGARDRRRAGAAGDRAWARR